MTNDIDLCDKIYVSWSNDSKYDVNKILTATNMAEILYGRHFSLKNVDICIFKLKMARG